MEDIYKLSLEELRSIAFKAKQSELYHKQHGDKWRISNPDKKKEHNKKYYEKKKLKNIEEVKNL